MTYAFNNVLSISNTTIVFVNVYSHNVFKVLRELSYVLSLVQKRHATSAESSKTVFIHVIIAVLDGKTSLLERSGF